MGLGEISGFSHKHTISPPPVPFGHFTILLPLHSTTPTMSKVTAVHTFVAEHGDELEFQAGETIEVIERDDGFGDGWWRVRLTLLTSAYL